MKNPKTFSKSSELTHDVREMDMDFPGPESVSL